MPYTPQELRSKIKEVNQDRLDQLIKTIDSSMLQWPGTGNIVVCTDKPINDILMQELKSKYTGWMVTYKANVSQRDSNYILTFSELKQIKPPDNCLLEFGGQSRP